MSKNEIIEKNTNALTSEDKINVLKEVATAGKNAMDNNTKDFNELCEVAKEYLKHSEPSTEYYKFLQKAIELKENDMNLAETEEKRAEIRKEIQDMIERADQLEKEINTNKQKTFEAVSEASKENRQNNWGFVKTLMISALAFFGGVYLGTKIDKK